METEKTIIFDVDMFEILMLVRQSLAFVRAHRRAQKEFEEHEEKVRYWMKPKHKSLSLRLI